jgi:putative alpha-1,2-mannosidase
MLNLGFAGDVKPLFVERAHAFSKENENSTPYVYEVTFNAESVNAGHNLTESIYAPVPGGAQPVPSVVSEGANGRTRRDAQEHAGFTAAHHRDYSGSSNGTANATIEAALTATAHVGWLRLEFPPTVDDPYVFVQATRQNWTGNIHIDPQAREISGSNPQRQDFALGPSRAPGFSGYFVSRFSEPFTSFGIAYGGDLQANITDGNGTELGAYVKFPTGSTVEVRTGVSFVSVEQARRNLDIEAPDSSTFEETVEFVKQTWLEKVGRVSIEGVNQTSPAHDPLMIFYTGLFHALQYPSDFSEPLTANGSETVFYSGYTDTVHEANDSYYQSWSIWDTY